ncbi:hypothetical protein D6D01_07886 [Aureobasidium pullulans]|uniref:Uncharacterized protein n=1 Tax=Aureobasidium pullulans TaxID=5580 RepID=A0A4S9KJ11_AURPU|nr:hypothetical protein D6D01_07886 [Aureobasidium pullulans]
MDNFSTTHHVPGVFPEILISPPQKQECTTALPRILATPSPPSRPLDAPARSYVQDPDPSPPQDLMRFGESNDNIPLPIHPVAPRHDDCSTTQTMDSSLKATPHFDGKLGTTRADVDAVSDGFVEQPAVDVSSVQDHHDHRGNTSQDWPSCSSLETQNRMLKQLLSEIRGERDEALSSVGSLQRWLCLARGDAGLDFTDFQYHAAPDKKIRTLEAKVADLNHQLHNACKYYNKLKDEVKASFGSASTAAPARHGMPPTTSPVYDRFDKAATLFALDIDARIGELQSAFYNEAQARAQVEEMAKSAKRMAAAGAEQAPFDEDEYKMMRSQIERYEYERIRNMVTDFQSTEEHIEEQIKTLDQELNTILAVNVPTPLEKSFNRLYIMVQSGSGYETIRARLEVLREKLRKEADRRRQAWALFTTTEALSPVATEFDAEEPISDYAAIAEHFQEYRSTVTVEESEDDQMGLSNAFSDTSSDGFDELVTYCTPQYFHDYQTAVAVKEPEDNQMWLSTAF